MNAYKQSWAPAKKKRPTQDNQEPTTTYRQRHPTNLQSVIDNRHLTTTNNQLPSTGTNDINIQQQAGDKKTINPFPGPLPYNPPQDRSRKSIDAFIVTNMEPTMTNNRQPMTDNVDR